MTEQQSVNMAATPPVHSRLRLLSLINVAAGVWMIAVPFVLHLPRTYPHQLTFLTFLLTGAGVLTLAVLHGLRWSEFRRASWANIALGVWLAVSPAFLGTTKYLPNGKTVVLVSLTTGVAVVAGGALCLAGSEKLSSRPLRRGRGHSNAPGVQPTLPQPVLWPPPRMGVQPKAFYGRVGGTDGADVRSTHRLAWAGIACLIVAAMMLGLALVLRSVPLASVGAVLVLAGAFLARKGRILSDTTIGQFPGRQ